MAYELKDQRMAGVTNHDAVRRQGASHWNSMTQQDASGQDFASRLLDSLRTEPALYPRHLNELSEGTWEQASSQLADFAHLFAIASHGWPVMAAQVAAGLRDELDTDLSAPDLALALFGDSIRHADCIRQLAVTVGPTRLRAGLTTAEANALSHRRRIEILLESERAGCAVGTAVALTLSWLRLTSLIGSALHAIASDRPAINIPGLEDRKDQPTLPPPALVRHLGAIAQSQPVRRGIQFGVGQVLALQATFWSMLAERARILAKRAA